jgi:hypothetical protein
MDLRTFSTNFDKEGLGIPESIVVKFVEGYREFMAAFQQTCLFVAAQDLNEEDQNVVKSSFLLRFSDFILNFNDMLSKYIVDTTYSVTAESVGDYVKSIGLAGESRDVRCVFIGSYGISGWNFSFYSTGYDDSWRDGLITSPTSYSAYLGYADGDGEFILEVADTGLGDSGSPWAAGQFTRAGVQYWYGMVNESRDIDVEIDLLDENFPNLRALADNVLEVLSALDLYSV